MKRPSDLTDTKTKTPRVDDDGSRKACYKFLAPAPLVASIMGRKGKIIQDIQAETNTFIKMTERGCIYPGTTSRLAMVLGHRAEDLNLTLAKVIEHLRECVHASGGSPQADMSDICPTNMPNAFIFTMIVPKLMRGVIIGPAGAQVSELRQLSGCKIKLDDGVPGDTIVKIEGALEGIQRVAQWITEEIQNMIDEDALRAWVQGGSVGNQGNMRNNKDGMDRQYRPGMENPRFGGQWQGQQQQQSTMQNMFQRGNMGPQNGGGRQMEALAGVPDNLAAIIQKVGQEVDHEQKTFSLQIPIPLDFKGALIGKGGCVVKDILHESHCSALNIQDIEGTEDCTVTIEGSVMACTAAYLLVMRRYVMHTRQAVQRKPVELPQQQETYTMQPAEYERQANQEGFQMVDPMEMDHKAQYGTVPVGQPVAEFTDYSRFQAGTTTGF